MSTKKVLTLYSGSGNFGWKAVEKGNLSFDTVIIIGALTAEGAMLPLPSILNPPGHVDNTHVKMVVNVYGENDPVLSGGPKRFDNVPTYNFMIKDTGHLGYFETGGTETSQKVAQWMVRLHANAADNTKLDQFIAEERDVISFDSEKNIWIVDPSKIK